LTCLTRGQIIPTLISPNPHDIGYLKSKRERSGHFIELVDEE